MNTLIKNALITGASRGIGKSIAHAMAQEGYNLILVCHNNIDILESYAKALTDEFGVQCRCYGGDIGSEMFCEEIFSDITSLDVLVNNAGISHIGLLQDMSAIEWNSIINTNLTSAFYTCRKAIPIMVSQKCGNIINISSMWGRVGASMEVAYSASKGGLNAMTQALAKELAPSNISVNAIACGVIDTDMNSHLSEEDKECLKNEIPADRFATPDEVATAVLSIIKAGPYMTGQIIGFDGGFI